MAYLHAQHHLLHTLLWKGAEVLDQGMNDNFNKH